VALVKESLVAGAVATATVDETVEIIRKVAAGNAATPSR
jgi:hypothetical protein